MGFLLTGQRTRLVRSATRQTADRRLTTPVRKDGGGGGQSAQWTRTLRYHNSALKQQNWHLLSLVWRHGHSAWLEPRAFVAGLHAGPRIVNELRGLLGCPHWLRQEASRGKLLGFSKMRWFMQCGKQCPLWENFRRLVKRLLVRLIKAFHGALPVIWRINGL